MKECSRADRLLLACLLSALAAGVFLRFLFPGDVEFKVDEIQGLLVGLEWLQSPGIAAHGMFSSIGLANAPATVYLFAVLCALSGGDPLAATLLVMLWNAAGLACFFVVAQLHLSGVFWGAGLAASILVLWPGRHRAKLPLLLGIGAGMLLVFYVPWLGHAWPEIGLFFSTDEAAAFFDELGPIWKCLQVLSGSAMGGVFVWATVRLSVRAVRRREPFLPASLGLSLTLFVFLFLLASAPIHYYYGAILIWPAAPICGFGWNDLQRALGEGQRGGNRWIVVTAVVVLVACAWTSTAFLFRIHATAGTEGDYGTALCVSMREVAKIPDGARLHDSAPLELRYLDDIRRKRRIDPAEYWRRPPADEPAASATDVPTTEPLLTAD
ncbi:hypothetical protein JW916_06205 [Candidatus Sumerlaeota bacterium]|nr:hypothetical protein [Candidatus Sumerlaeota bacterium]